MSAKVLVVDDIDVNRGFHSFSQSFSGHCFIICEAEPLRPDLRRANKKGMFGIILKEPVAGNQHSLSPVEGGAGARRSAT